METPKFIKTINDLFPLRSWRLERSPVRRDKLGVKKMEKMFCRVIVWMCLATLFNPSAHAKFVISGYSAFELRLFTNSPVYSGQESDPQVSWLLEPELRYESEDRRHQLKVTPFMRWDTIDTERSHVDFREAFWRMTFENWVLLIGMDKVFWGVAESQHLVDIINQTDTVEDIDAEDKLGQPMILVSTQRDWGEAKLFILPYFRERTFPGRGGRLRTPVPVDDDGRFESGAEAHHPDMALRYAHYIGDWDIGGTIFHGTAREPVLLPDALRTCLIPYYEIINQFGTDIQYTHEAWLWKFEGMLREGQGRFFGALVGGFEYTRYQIFHTAADLGFLAEYHWDGRDQHRAPPTTFDNDFFGGIRISLNDVADTQALMGSMVDIENGSTLMMMEAQRRVAQSFVLEIQGRFFLDIAPGDLLKFIAQDDFLTISLQYHF